MPAVRSSMRALLPVLAALAPAAALADPVVDARFGALTTRLPGMPTARMPARTVVSAEVRQDLVKGRLSGTVVLGGVPAAASDATLVVEFGHVVGTRCEGDPDSWVISATAKPKGNFKRVGRTITFDVRNDEADWQDWGCAVVGLTARGGRTTLYDALGGMLEDVRAVPRLRLGKPALLGRTGQPIGLVPGVWTVIEVPVNNDGRVPAKQVVVRGAGKGIEVRPVRLGEVASSTRNARVEVRLTGRQPATLRLTARSGKAAGSTNVAVRPIPAPARPQEGRYESPDGTVTFEIRKGKVVNWYGRGMQMRCAPPLEFPTYRTVSLEFGTTPVARSGIVDATEKWDSGAAWYNASLEMRVAGKAATAGVYTYHTSGSCSVGVGFTARWTGR